MTVMPLSETNIRYVCVCVCVCLCMSVCMTSSCPCCLLPLLHHESLSFLFPLPFPSPLLTVIYLSFFLEPFPFLSVTPVIYFAFLFFSLLTPSLTFSYFSPYPYHPSPMPRRSLLGLLTASIMEVASNFQNVAFQLVRSIVDAKIIVPEVSKDVCVRSSHIPCSHPLSPFFDTSFSLSHSSFLYALCLCSILHSHSLLSLILFAYTLLLYLFSLLITVLVAVK
jgi:hypothetical protein